ESNGPRAERVSAPECDRVRGNEPTLTRMNSIAIAQRVSKIGSHARDRETAKSPEDLIIEPQADILFAFVRRRGAREVGDAGEHRQIDRGLEQPAVPP